MPIFTTRIKLFMRYYIVDAFTDRPFGGNPAGVVLLGEEAFPDESLMIKVAAELRYSETAFVQRLSATEYHLRYFTPKAEVELCGHATIATFSLLHSLGIAEGECRCRTLAGDLCIEVGEKVLMQMSAPRIVKTIADIAPIYRALGINGYIPSLPVQVAYTGLEDIMIPIQDVEVLNALHPDMEAVAALTEENVHVRCFAYELAASRFSDVTAVLQEIIFAPFDQRLASFLLREAEASPDGQIRMTQGEMAARVNSAREVVARMLKRFDEEGLIEYGRGRIVLRDRERLEKLSEH
jgi:PhzF family phenazine biosynthesis protein